MKNISKKILVISAMLFVLNPFGFNTNDFVLIKNIANAEDCNIISAKWVPAGERSDNFFTENSTTASIDVKTKNCVGKTGLSVSVYESDGTTSMTDDVWNDSGLYEKNISAPTDNFSIDMMLGEEDCENLVGGGVGYDCDLYFKIQNNNNTYNSYNQSAGMLYYDCDGLCLNNGKFLGITPKGTDDDPVDITSKYDEVREPNVYKLLAPIGELKEIKTNNIGVYFNLMFKIIIALCGVLAVIMIVIGGIQYMGDESIFGKTEAKKKIFSAILGLLLALGSYALLNTINPDLLGSGGLNVAQVSADIEEEDVPLTSNDSFTPGQKTEKCTTGIVNANTVNGNIPTCSTLKTNIEKLISDANKAGYKIFGYGYRSKEKQEQLRAKNCGGQANIYNTSAKCNPLTAYPGKSRHENGLAVDFTCDGVTIKSRDNKCFLWLKNNAHKSEYGGLKNLQKEPWHWSIDGK